MRRMFNQAKFAKRIRVAIAARGIDQKTAAREIGTTDSAISRICNGGVEPRASLYLLIENWLAKQESAAKSA